MTISEIGRADVLVAVESKLTLLVAWLTFWGCMRQTHLIVMSSCEYVVLLAMPWQIGTGQLTTSQSSGHLSILPHPTSSKPTSFYICASSSPSRQIKNHRSIADHPHTKNNRHPLLHGLLLSHWKSRHYQEYRLDLWCAWIWWFDGWVLQWVHADRKAWHEQDFDEIYERYPSCHYWGGELFTGWSDGLYHRPVWDVRFSEYL